MNILFDPKRFAELSQHYWDACQVSLFFKAHAGAVNYEPPVMCEICQVVRRIPSLRAQCSQCASQARQRCHETQEIQVYACHLGFTEVVLPVLLDTILIGYLSFGQIVNTDVPHSAQTIRELLEKAMDKHGFAIDDYQAKIDRSVHMDDRRIRATSELARLSASHMVLSNIIKPEAFSLSFLLDTYIEQHLGDPITCQDICAALSISRSQLYNIAKRRYGCGVMDWVHRRRLERAKELLTATSIEISVICEQIGIPDSSYFSRFFKQETGLSPTQYRKAHLLD